MWIWHPLIDVMVDIERRLFKSVEEFQTILFYYVLIYVGSASIKLTCRSWRVCVLNWKFAPRKKSLNWTCVPVPVSHQNLPFIELHPSRVMWSWIPGQDRKKLFDSSNQKVYLHIKRYCTNRCHATMYCWKGSVPTGSDGSRIWVYLHGKIFI